MIEHDQRSILLEIATKAIENTVLKRREEDTNTPDDPEFAAPHAGVFVTITVDGALRGCIGDLDSQTPLRKALIHAAESACARDYRFDAIRPKELERMAIDITLLEPMEEVRGEDDIVVGEHGVFIEDGGHRGILLPQVAVARHWSARRFLEALCEKASLPIDAWTRDTATLKRFRARIISSSRAS